MKKSTMCGWSSYGDKFVLQLVEWAESAAVGEKLVQEERRELIQQLKLLRGALRVAGHTETQSFSDLLLHLTPPTSLWLTFNFFKCQNFCSKTVTIWVSCGFVSCRTCLWCSADRGQFYPETFPERPRCSPDGVQPAVHPRPTSYPESTAAKYYGKPQFPAGYPSWRLNQPVCVPFVNTRGRSAAAACPFLFPPSSGCASPRYWLLLVSRQTHKS